jgi:uncharacterized protein (DUF885 family)
MTEPRPFGELAAAFLHEEFEHLPTRASGLGLAEYDGRFEDLSAAGWQARDAMAATWLGRFDAVPDAGLGFDARIDRDLIRSALRGRLILADFENWRRDPTLATQLILDGIFRLLLHRLRPEAELADVVVERLEAVPAALLAAWTNLDPSLGHPLIIGRAVGSARGGLRYLRDLLPAEFEDPERRTRVADAAGRAAVGFERWIDRLEDLQQRATGTWALGEERYSRLLREREVLADDARSLRTRGQAEYDRLDAEMRALAHRIDGTDDWVAVVVKADEEHHPPTEDAMRASYERWTEKARRFLADTGLVTLPAGERCLVEPSPIYQRPILAVASYVAPPMYSDAMTGHFFVPFAPDGTPDDEVQKRLANNSDSGIPTTAVHEAYPGHHWHLVMVKSNPSLVRRAFGTTYFTEGWALYAERAMREQGFFEDPLHELQHLSATIFRAARIIVDTSLHMGEMSVEEATRFMVEKAGLPEPTAKAEVGRYCAWPTQASGYLTGCLEILRIRDAYLAKAGVEGPAAKAPIERLRAFNDSLTSSGMLPLGLAEQAVLATL